MFLSDSCDSWASKTDRDRKKSDEASEAFISIKSDVSGTNPSLRKICEGRERIVVGRKNSLAVTREFAIRRANVTSICDSFGSPTCRASHLARIAIIIVVRMEMRDTRGRVRCRSHLARKARRAGRKSRDEKLDWYTGRIHPSSAASWRSPLEVYECLRTNATAAFGH
jgi:hypothetical protein